MSFEKIYKFYDLIYHDKDYEGEAKHVIKIINDINPGNTILEYGSGTGNYSKFFLKQGFKLTGIELSEEMHNVAQKNGINSIHHNMIDFKSNKLYNNAVALFHVFSYIKKNDEINLFFKNLSKNINKGGLFIFDAWYTPSVLKQKPSIRTKKYIDDEVLIKRTSFPENIISENIVKVKFEFNVQYLKKKHSEKVQETHYMRHFSIPEIEDYCLKYGFKLIDSCELISKKPPSLKTWALLHTIQKI